MPLVSLSAVDEDRWAHVYFSRVVDSVESLNESNRARSTQSKQYQAQFEHTTTGIAPIHKSLELGDPPALAS